MFRYRQEVQAPVEVVAVTQDESLIGITLSVGKGDGGVIHAVVSTCPQAISQPCLDLIRLDEDDSASKWVQLKDSKAFVGSKTQTFPPSSDYGRRNGTT
jgi:hypothetical protein